VKQLSDKIVATLQAEMQAPDLTGTRYRLVRFLARGGMGSVWLVEDTVLQRQVALKVLDPVARTGDLATRLLQEVRILSRLEHPGIVPVYDAGTLSDGRAFYCMKYVEGQTLAQHIVSKSLPDRLRLLERIAEPVDFAHSRGFIHRDLKPENVMIGAFGEVLVMDWGLARVGVGGLKPAENEIANLLGPTPMASRVTGQGSVLGTPGYMSPEQALGNTEVDHRTDIFSLGAILWSMLTGSARGELPAASGSVPRPLRAICEKAMAADPKARYQSAREMTADIANYLNGGPVCAYPESFLERTGRIYARHNTAVALVAVYLFTRLLFILLARR
jgi:eukaryotic-like serine/threonine-protein kinase